MENKKKFKLTNKKKLKIYFLKTFIKLVIDILKINKRVKKTNY